MQKIKDLKTKEIEIKPSRKIKEKIKKEKINIDNLNLRLEFEWPEKY